MRIWRLTLVVLMVSLLAWQPRAAAACSCAGEWGADSAEAIFSGVVIGKESPSRYGLIAAVIRNFSTRSYAQGVIFKVDEAWQGVGRDEITLQNGAEWSCGYPFERGERYLVYANRQDDGFLHTSVCGEIVPIDEAQGELTQLSETSTLELDRVPRVTPFEIFIFAIISLLIYWWIFMVRAIRANPLRF